MPAITPLNGSTKGWPIRNLRAGGSLGQLLTINNWVRSDSGEQCVALMFAPRWAAPFRALVFGDGFDGDGDDEALGFVELGVASG
jgi:hypothetical protein